MFKHLNQWMNLVSVLVYFQSIFHSLDKWKEWSLNRCVRWLMILSDWIAAQFARNILVKLWLAGVEMGQMILHMGKCYTFARQLWVAPEVIYCCQVAPNQKLTKTPEHNSFKLHLQSSSRISCFLMQHIFSCLQVLLISEDIAWCLFI